MEVRGGKSTSEDKEGTSAGVEGIREESGGKQGEGCCKQSGNGEKGPIEGICREQSTSAATMG